jgi:hypothetical protein
MLKWLNKALDRFSEFLAPRKGLLPIIGIILIIVNYIIQFLPTGWIGPSNLLLHIGILVAIFGFMLAWAL